MRKPIDNSSGPYGGLWVWKCPETGFIIRHGNYPGIRNAVKTYLRANNYPIGSNFDEALDENLCANAAPQTCEDFVPPTFLEKMSSLAQALYHAAKSWREPVVTAELLQERRDICAGCSFYGGSKSLLKVACVKCGCTGLALYLPTKHCPLPQPEW
jgi:hypothetical protein